MNPLPRTLRTRLVKAVASNPVVCVTGPRQSGKTTLVRDVLADWSYVSLEAPDTRQFAMEDPRGFLGQFAGPLIIDEAQRVPDLFSYIQTVVDDRAGSGHYVLTGSHNFLLLESISQSLAGRTSILNLLPFSLPELLGRPEVAAASLEGMPQSALADPPQSLEETLFAGFYPRIHDRGLEPRQWLADYYQTYVERDVRTILSVGNLESFGRFVRLCAGRTGQLLNLSSLASDCGVTHTTAKRWLSVLEASFLVYLLRPHHRNFGKRLIKRPKLYFLDTGLLCYLLGIRSAADVQYHSARGSIFESFVVAELIKSFLHQGEQVALHFWRDSAGHEVDILIDADRRPLALEVKSGATIASDFFDGLRYWRSLAPGEERPTALVYGGDLAYVREGVAVHPWYTL
jgi:uncharacterized protein